MYDELLEHYALANKNVLELGVGPGLELEKIWRKKPENLLGVDIDPQMMDVAKNYLTLQGHPVNVAYNNSPSFCLKKDSINLSIADYANFTTFDTSLSEFFDIAFLTFVGGDNGSAVQNVYAVFDAVGTADFLLKPGGKFIYIERVFCKNQEDIKRCITTPAGYTLGFFEFDTNQKYVEAAYYGNKHINIAVNGIPNELTADDSMEDGVLAKAMCDVLKENFDVNAGILRMDFIKT